MGMLEKTAAVHFEAKDAGTLLGGVLNGLKVASIAEYLPCENVLVRQAVCRLLHRNRHSDAVQGTLFDALKGEAGLRAGTVMILSGLQPALNWPGLVSLILANLRHPDLSVRKAAARCVAFRYPERAEALLPLCCSADASADGITFACYSQNPHLILPLLKILGDTSHLPPMFGFLLSPGWLAAHATAMPDLVSRLAVEFGYADAPPCPLLSGVATAGLHVRAADQAWGGRPRSLAETD